MPSSCLPPPPPRPRHAPSEKEAAGVSGRAEESRGLPQTVTPLAVRVRLQGGKVARPLFTHLQGQHLCVKSKPCVVLRRAPATRPHGADRAPGIGDHGRLSACHSICFRQVGTQTIFWLTTRISQLSSTALRLHLAVTPLK